MKRSSPCPNSSYKSDANGFRVENVTVNWNIILKCILVCVLGFFLRYGVGRLTDFVKTVMIFSCHSLWVIL